MGVIYLFIFSKRSLDTCIGLLFFGEHGFSYMPDYPAGDIW
jgi:hypothetical protein